MEARPFLTKTHLCPGSPCAEFVVVVAIFFTLLTTPGDDTGTNFCSKS